MPLNNDCSIAILAKAPVPGYSKTRLIPQLGAKGAARLQQQLIARTIQTALAARLGSVRLYYTPDRLHGEFIRLRRRFGITLHRQTGTNLGQRMLGAVRRELKHRARVIILGTDCPFLSPQYLEQACQLLEQHDHVLQPAEDGGYVMIASRRYEPAVFRNIHWGTDRVMRQSRRRLAAVHGNWAELPMLPDLDEWPDLLRAQQLGLLGLTIYSP